MRYLKTLCVAVAIASLMAGYVLAAENDIKTVSQQVCPVMFDGNVGCSILKKEFYTDYKGKRIYFCSKGCQEKFKTDPEKYIKRLKEKGVTFEDAPETGN